MQEATELELDRTLKTALKTGRKPVSTTQDNVVKQTLREIRRKVNYNE